MAACKVWVLLLLVVPPNGRQEFKLKLSSLNMS